MIGKKLEAILLGDLQSLIDNQVRESRTIEYKQELPGGSDSHRKEFLADVSSFANTSGGDIVFGIEEVGGTPRNLRGLWDFDEDKARLRIESIIRDGLDPRIPDPSIQVVRVPSKGPVLVLRIPKSWRGPHMVSFQDSGRFFARSSAGKFQMDTAQLRSAFLNSADAPARVRAWRDQRLLTLGQNGAPVTLARQTWFALHLIPLDSLESPLLVDAAAIEQFRTELGPIYTSGRNDRFNLDGFLTFGGNDTGSIEERSSAYCQVYRSGQIESLYAGREVSDGGKARLKGPWLESAVIVATARYLQVLSKLGFGFPVAVSLSFVGFRGATIEGWFPIEFDRAPIDRSPLVLPEVVLEEPPSDLPQALRPLFDAMWNASGAAHSPDYDAQGRWIGVELPPHVPRVG